MVDISLEMFVAHSLFGLAGFTATYAVFLAKDTWFSCKKVGGLTFVRLGRFGFNYYVTNKPVN